MARVVQVEVQSDSRSDRPRRTESPHYGEISRAEHNLVDWKFALQRNFGSETNFGGL